MAIVVGVTDRPDGLAALSAAGREAEERNEQLLVVAHLEIPRNEDGAIRYREDRAAMEARIRALAAEHVGDRVEWTVEIPLASGNAADAVLSAAARDDVTWIIIGSRRRSAVSKFILGSNAQTIILNATVPVLVVKSSIQPI